MFVETFVDVFVLCSGKFYFVGILRDGLWFGEEEDGDLAEDAERGTLELVKEMIDVLDVFSGF